MLRFLTLLPCLYLGALIASGQSLEWHITADIPASLADRLPVELNGEPAEQIIRTGIDRFHQEGYLLARITSVGEDSTRIAVHVDPGEQYRWAWLSGGNLPDKIRNRIGFRPGRYEFSPVSKSRLELLFERILREAEHNGYPYASVRLDSIVLSGAEVGAAIHYEPGMQVRYGRLVLSDSSLVNPGWLAAYLDLRPGELYDRRTVERIIQRIESLDFIELDSRPREVFRGQTMDVYLDVQKVSANRLDAIVGFLPNEERDGGLRITGEAELHLANLFRSGKIFDLHWQRMRPETQYLELYYFHPNLFRSNLNASLAFQFLKEDTTFTNRDFDIRLDYTNGQHTFSALSRFRAGRLLDVPPDLESLPEAADFNLNDYGLAYAFHNIRPGWLGYRGFRLMADARVGNKNIRRNTAVPPELYEGIDEDLLQWSANFSGAWGFLTGRQTLLYQYIEGGVMDADLLFQNDLYRLGGFRSIRGFNENQFFARQYVRYTLEWQLYFDRSSNLMLFVDQAFYRSLDSSDNPTGIGAGLTLQTGGGLLQLAYAVGRTRDQSFDLRLSKFHFGYKAKF